MLLNRKIIPNDNLNIKLVTNNDKGLDAKRL